MDMVAPGCPGGIGSLGLWSHGLTVVFFPACSPAPIATGRGKPICVPPGNQAKRSEVNGGEEIGVAPLSGWCQTDWSLVGFKASSVYHRWALRSLFLNLTHVGEGVVHWEG